MNAVNGWPIYITLINQLKQCYVLKVEKQHKVGILETKKLCSHKYFEDVFYS